MHISVGFFDFKVAMSQGEDAKAKYLLYLSVTILLVVIEGNRLSYYIFSDLVYTSAHID